MGREQQPVDARELFEALRDHQGPDAYGAVVAAWLDRAGSGYRTRLAEAAERLCRAAFDGAAPARADLSWEIYALSRVNDVLLLSFQAPVEAAAEALHPFPWPTVAMRDYLRFSTRLGLVPFEDRGTFDPFLHEIVEVEQAADPDEPIRVIDVVWPGLWLGPLLFSRAGVKVLAGARHAERGVADRSPLYWAFLRRNRPTVDLSHGWGHNSQWRTDFRLDHRTEAGECVNAGGGEDIDAAAGADAPGALLTPEERRLLLRHRCLLRTPSNAAALASMPGWETDLHPFDWRLPAAGTTCPPLHGREGWGRSPAQGGP
ncbi:hypothetical protein [Streptomyces sp. NPDC049040]|uniref:hypothetical protein n=1 Tax=Streptomyces sp. NPDC049040 TaxID=3365593 RepID=UPI00371E6F83